MPSLAAGKVVLHYEVHGSWDPLVLLMGFGATSKDWHAQLPAFSAHYQTIIYDHRGTGASDKPQTGYSIEQFADDCIAVLDHLSIARAHLVGYSMGGRVAQSVAARYPERVGALVLAATAARPNALNLYSLKVGTFLYENYGPAAAAAVGPLIDFTHQHFEQTLPALLERLGVEPYEPLPLHAVKGHVAAIEQHDTTAVLSQIRAPTLIVLGDQEWLNPMADANQMKAGISGARIEVIAGASHGLIWEQPDRFNDCVLQFLAQHK